MCKRKTNVQLLMMVEFSQSSPTHTKNTHLQKVEEVAQTKHQTETRLCGLNFLRNKYMVVYFDMFLGSPDDCGPPEAALNDLQLAL